MVKLAVESDQFGVAAEHLRADRVERAEPRHALDRVADDAVDSLASSRARRLLVKVTLRISDGVRLAGVEQMREPRGQCGGLAGARAGEDQHRAIGGEHGFALRRVEAGEIGWLGMGFGRETHR